MARKAKIENAMIRGPAGSNVTPQDRGAGQDIAVTSSNPYFTANYWLRWQSWVRWYETDWCARKIINIPVDDAFRIQFRLTGLPDAAAKDLMADWRHHKGDVQFKRCCKQQRLLGGCCLYLGATDFAGEGAPKADQNYRPLNLKVIDKNQKALRCLNVIDINLVSRTQLPRDPLAEDYEQGGDFLIDGRRVHPSRLIVFDGDPLFNRNNRLLLQQYHINPTGFGESVLTPLFDNLVRTTGTQEGAYHLINLASVLLATVKDYKAMAMTKPGEATLAKVAEMIRSMSIYRAAILDGTDAEIKQHTASFGSVPELLMQFLVILSAASDIPATRFLGQAPGGLNATGESDLENYYNSIDGWQTDVLKPRLLQFFDVAGVCRFGLDAWAKMKAVLDIEFPPLWNQDAKEQADTAKTWIEAYKPLYDSGMMTVEQISEELNARRVFMSPIKLQEALEEEPEDPTAPVDPAGPLKQLKGEGGDDKGGEGKERPFEGGGQKTENAGDHWITKDGSRILIKGDRKPPGTPLKPSDIEGPTAVKTAIATKAPAKAPAKAGGDTPQPNPAASVPTAKPKPAPTAAAQTKPKRKSANTYTWDPRLPITDKDIFVPRNAPWPPPDDFDEERAKWATSLNSTQREAILKWKTRSWEEFQAREQGKTMGDEYAKELTPQEYDEFQKALDNAPRYEGQVHRGLMLTDAEISKLAKQTSMSFKYTQSTGFDLDVCNKFAVGMGLTTGHKDPTAPKKIACRFDIKAKNALDLTQFGESEMLLRKGTKLKIVKAERGKITAKAFEENVTVDGWIFTMEEV